MMHIKNYIIQLLLLLLLLCPIIILQACCSSMLAIGTAAFITTWHDSRTVGTQLDDNILSTHIAHSLNQNQYIKKLARIKSTVYQNNVLLTGQSPSISLSEDAVKIVMKINGVKNIYNAIRQNKPIPLKSILKDTWISSKIYFNLFKTQGLQASCIKIITENQEVFLLGQVTHEEGEYIKKTASAINEVKNVFSAFIYI